MSPAIGFPETAKEGFFFPYSSLIPSFFSLSPNTPTFQPISPQLPFFINFSSENGFWALMVQFDRDKGVIDKVLILALIDSTLVCHVPLLLTYVYKNGTGGGPSFVLKFANASLGYFWDIKNNIHLQNDRKGLLGTGTN